MINKKIIKYIKEEIIDEEDYIPPRYFLKTKWESDSSNFKIEEKVLKKEVPKEISEEITKKIASKEESLEILRKKVSDCRKCKLGFSRNNAVFGVGNPYSSVMFVGEGPGWDEDHKGEPFVGRAGQLLDKILLSIELDRTKVYIANIVKCHPMINPETPEARGNDRPPSEEEISACRFYIEEQIRIIKPKCIVTLGNTATRFILNEKTGVSKLRGKFYDIPQNFFFDFEIKVLPTYHPAALLRNPSLKKETWEDMKMLRDWLKSQ
ncbi:MAG: uracil-DNA glycosylase [Elusimicrobiales bacterium]